MSTRVFHAVALAFVFAAGGCARETVELVTPRIVDAPAGPGSQCPNLAVGLNGDVYLSWIEPRGNGHALRFSTWRDGRWTTPKTVADGDSWFVNWADFPSMAALADGTLAAHWLARSGDSTYAYDILVALSRDGGETWSAPLRPHRDATETEHGFVTLVATSDGHFDVIWLDGRRTGDPVPGGMTLRYAALDRDGGLRDETEIDAHVCDCCSTDAIRARDGSLLAAYRDRSEGEIRDISVSRLEDGRWSPPRTVHADRWETSACPVNGPALASAGNRVAVSWFTAAGGRAQVQAAFSRDGGRTFGQPVRIDEGDPLGRIDVVMLDEESALVSWLEREGERARIALRRATPSGVSQTTFVATTSQARSSGFPRMAAGGDQVILAWTEGDDPSRIGTAVFGARQEDP